MFKRFAKKLECLFILYVTGLNISSAAEDNNKGWILSKPNDFLQSMLSKSKKTSTSLTLVKRKVHFFLFIKDEKWRSALGKLDASSAGTLQKYLLIAFDIEAGC